MIIDKLQKLLNEELPNSIWEGTIYDKTGIEILIHTIVNQQKKFIGGILHITNKKDQAGAESIPILKMAPAEGTDITGCYRPLMGVLEYNLKVLGKLQITITNT
jgi:hypothetical protein